jgi:hypothetical protein
MMCSPKAGVFCSLKIAVEAFSIVNLCHKVWTCRGFSPGESRQQGSEDMGSDSDSARFGEIIYSLGASVLPSVEQGQ